MANYNIPVPQGLRYYDYQLQSIIFQAHNTCVYNASEPGTGKTIQVIGTLNALDMTDKRILIICPATIKSLWADEIDKWLVHPYSVDVATGKYFPNTDIVIINYDILKNHIEILSGTEWGMVVFDEAHYLKNRKTAKRTRMCVGFDGKGGLKADRVIALSGTPVLSSPEDLYPVIKYMFPETVPSWFRYVVRYCGAYKAPWGWVTKGASNLDELKKVLGRFMIRHRKCDVLRELPDKYYRVITIDGDEDLPSIDKSNPAMALAQLAEIRHETAFQKIDYVVDHAKNHVVSGNPVVIFAWHTDVIEDTCRRLRQKNVRVRRITGATPQSRREETIEKFQDGEVDVLVCNIIAAGTGITLTRSSNVIFLELDWVVGNLRQAEDRCHRIGTKNNVLIEYVVVKDSIDEHIVKALGRKRKVADELDVADLKSEIINIY